MSNDFKGMGCAFFGGVQNEFYFCIPPLTSASFSLIATINANKYSVADVMQRYKEMVLECNIVK
jgi:hypothetical protein